MHLPDPLRAKLDHIEAAIAKLAPDAALTLLDPEIENPDNADLRPHIEFLKGVILSSAQRSREAAEFLDQCAARNSDVDDLQHHAGLYLLETGEFARAVPRLSRCLQLAASSGNRWYEASARLLRAYCAAKIGDVVLARRDLAAIADDHAMEWVKGTPNISKSSVRRMLANGDGSADAAPS